MMGPEILFEIGIPVWTTMTTTTYAEGRTALLIVDPYNDFMSEGGKFLRGPPRRRPRRSAFTTICASIFTESDPRPKDVR